MKWVELNSPRLGSVSRETICVTPLGAMEQHGPHLPVAKVQTAESRRTILAITVPLSKSLPQAHWPSALGLTASPVNASTPESDPAVPIRRAAA